MNTIFPFLAAYYSKKNRASMEKLAVADLDSAQHLWGATDASFSFRNVLVGPPEICGETWHSWIAAKEVDISDSPSFYILNQSFRQGSIRVNRWAVYAAMELDNEKIYIHEDVIPEGVERARQCTEACESDMAPIFMGCAQELSQTLRIFLQESVRYATPLLEYEEGAHKSYRLWRMDNPVQVLKLQEMFQEKELYVMDGHHRFAAAKENYRLGIGDGKILACLCSMELDDIFILPIHRAVYCERWALEEVLVADLVRAGCKVVEGKNLRVQDLESVLHQKHAGERVAFALYAHTDRLLCLELPPMPDWRSELSLLPVAVLDNKILHSLDRLTTIPIADFRHALDQLAHDQAHVVFFLPPATVEQVRAVAKAGLKMPRKSTRFVPKPPLGLVCRPWR